MAKVTLTGCAHPFTKNWSRDEDGWTHMTCLACYQRLKQFARDEPKVNDTPVIPGQCEHRPKDALTPNRDARFASAVTSHDALCTDCGCVVRHPDGKGAWEEVIWNGFLILEMP